MGNCVLEQPLPHPTQAKNEPPKRAGRVISNYIKLQKRDTVHKIIDTNILKDISLIVKKKLTLIQNKIQ